MPSKRNSARYVSDCRNIHARADVTPGATNDSPYFPFLSVTAVALSISALERYIGTVYFSRREIHTRGSSSENSRCLVFLARFFVAARNSARIK